MTAAYSPQQASLGKGVCSAQGDMGERVSQDVQLGKQTQALGGKRRIAEHSPSSAALTWPWPGSFQSSSWHCPGHQHQSSWPWPRLRPTALCRRSPLVGRPLPVRILRGRPGPPGREVSCSEPPRSGWSCHTCRSSFLSPALKQENTNASNVGDKVHPAPPRGPGREAV